MIGFHSLSQAWERKISAIEKEKNILVSLAAFLFLGFLLFLILSSQLGVRNIMEARNFKAAEEIIESGNWLFPTLNGAPRIVKPPLPTWAVAVVGKWMGDTRNLFWLRLPNLLASMLLLVFVFLLLRDLTNTRSAFWATLLLLTSLNFLGQIFIARWDMFACSLGLGALWATCRMMTRKSFSYFWLALLLLSASYLSKGPVAIYTIFLPFFLALAGIFLLPGSKEGEDPKLRAFLPQGWKAWSVLVGLLILACLLGHSWWFAVQVQHPETLHILQSDLESLQERHSEPFYYYFLQSFLLMAPWSLFLLLALVFCFSRFLSFSTKQKPGQPEGKRDTNLLFSFLFFCVSLILLSLIDAKKNRYFLMITPSCAIFLGCFCEHLVAFPSKIQEIFWLKQAFRLHRGLLVILLCVIPGALLLATYYGLPIYFVLLCFLFWPLAWLVAQGKWSLSRLVVELSLTVLLVSMLVLPMLHSFRLLPEKYENAYEVKKITAGLSLYSFENEDDRLLWAIGRNYIPLFGKKARTLPSGPAFIIVEDAKEEPFQKVAKGARLQKIYIFHENKKQKITWSLYKIE